MPKKTDSTFNRNGFYLAVNDKEYTDANNGKLGCKVYLVNTADTAVRISAIDSYIPVIIQALDENKQWKPISYSQTSSCGNSYHTIVLDTNEYWEFTAPVFDGAMKTRIRYALFLNDNQVIFSNETEASINKEQFDPQRKQGYSPKSIMDPYQD
ncbi:MAG: hypothetical protein MUC87_18725 [Bacteroidia bacterium]|nr:hypothetical protein [Bacteroidia bacterium]